MVRNAKSEHKKKITYDIMKDQARTIMIGNNIKKLKGGSTIHKNITL